MAAAQQNELRRPTHNAADPAGAQSAPGAANERGSKGSKGSPGPVPEDDPPGHHPDVERDPNRPVGDEILGSARRLFGFQSLLPGQREAVEASVAGRDALVVMATGAGKSAIYALAGQLRRAVTLVISPLLALQRDQSEPLKAAGLRVCTLNSDIPAAELDECLASIERGEVDFVYLAPEQLAAAEVVEAVAAARPALVAVDEAHLVSQWGQDFRPDYLRIAPAVEAVGRPPILALTATAAPPVRQDIIDHLQLRSPEVLVRGFDRPNIFLGVHGYFATDLDKLEALRHDVLEAISELGRGIVYAATRKGVEGLARDWQKRGAVAVPYHAGLSRRRRLSVEDDFHENRVDVIVATVAFGMGVDKPDIRWVYHADLPPSIDAYYQEIGRSGRDGGPARAVLYYRPEDVRLPRMYASRAGPSANALRAVAGALAGGARSLEEVMDKTGLRRTGATSGIETLSGTGAITLDAAGTINLVSDLQEGLDAALSLVARRRQMERTRVDTMQAYAETLTCRRRFILEYFGEPCADACRNCDNHESTLTASRREVPFPRGSRVEHSVFGPGQILGYAGEEVLISFAEAGYRRLDLGLVEENDLLRLQEGGSRRRDEL